MNIPTSNLKLILDKFKETIKPDQFNFSTYVAYGQPELNCGTVCCILGWFPLLFPNSGITWKKDWADRVTIALNDEIIDMLSDIVPHICDLIGTDDEEIIRYLFFGQQYIRGLPNIGLESSYDEVVEAWEYVIDKYEIKPRNQFALS